MMDVLFNWVVIVVLITVALTILVSWLASYRTPKAVTFGSSRWFALPTWAQVGGGLIVMTLFATLGYALWIPILGNRTGGLLKMAGLALFGLGAFVVLWGRRALGRQYGVSTVSAAQLRSLHRLVEQGPYAHVRHPMYLGMWLLFVGAVLAYWTWASLIFFFASLPLYWRARREEAALASAFGDAWREYEARVPPFLPRWIRKRKGT